MQWERAGGKDSSVKDFADDHQNRQHNLGRGPRAPEHVGIVTQSRQRRPLPPQLAARVRGD
jgi:hypothetical protein